MAATSACFKEVLQSSRSQHRWKEVTINTGGAPSPLQDIKLPESAGGYVFKDSGYATSTIHNRYIYWRVKHDVVEFVEQSMNVNLSCGRVRYRFTDTPVLSGINIFETQNEVIILVSTVSSVHRLAFLHPIKLRALEQNAQLEGDRVVNSVFHDAGVAQCKSHPIQINNNPGFQLHTSSSWLGSNGDALFALATNSGSVLLIKMPNQVQGLVMQFELKQSSMIQRLWSGIMPSAIRGNQDDLNMALSVCLYPLSQETFLFSICKDYKIRMWSCKTHECLMTLDVLELLPDSIDPLKISAGARGHIIKKASESGQLPSLGTFLSFSDRCMFLILRPALINGVYQLEHLTTIPAPNKDLIDFTLTNNNLWTVWTNSEGDTSASCVSIDTNNICVGRWREVFLETPDSSELLVPNHLSPHEFYLNNIFCPSKFSTQAIIKALNIYRQSADSMIPVDHPVSMPTLREEVIVAVENEIQLATSSYDLSEENLYQLQLEQWNKFYSSCLQYNEVGNKTVGLVADDNSGLVFLIKKNCLSILRPCNVTELLYLSSSESLNTQDLDDMRILWGDAPSQSDLVNLMQCLNLIGDQMSPEMASTFEQELSILEHPSILAQQVVASLLPEPGSGDVRANSLSHDVSNKVQCIVDVLSSMENILQSLDVQSFKQEFHGLEAEFNGFLSSSANQLYASDSTICMLCNSLSRLIDQRLLLARDLLILQTLMLQLGEEGGLTTAQLDKLISDLIPKAAIFVQAYYLLKWISQTSAQIVETPVIESNIRQLAALDLSDNTNYATSKTKALLKQNVSLLELFLHDIGGGLTRQLLSYSGFAENDLNTLWHLPLEFIWPLNDDFIFPEFLMSQCQYGPLQEYVRLTQDWCVGNVSSRNFLLGQCYLNTGEPEKALECIQQAAHGACSEPYLTNRLLQLDESEERDQAQVQTLYYLKVIKLFEQFHCPDLVIALANTAISITNDDDINQATLWSKKFKHHLETGHNEEAYSAMVSNTDPSRRKDCLRQFLVTLFERNELQTFVEFPYIDMYDDVVSIMESRARSVDLATHNYYDLLYAFHIYRGNYRKASSVMYEYGMRLAAELPGLKSIQRQAKCYLTAMNCLRLVDPDYAWIVRPTMRRKQRVVDSSPPKRNFSGDILDSDIVPKLDVVELKDIEKEYVLIYARLKLLQKNTETSILAGPTPSADEMVGLLVNNGFFDMAARVCQEFSLSMTSVFEGLTSRCVWLAQGVSTLPKASDKRYAAEAWDWLNYNNLDQYLSSKEFNSADYAWQILQEYLTQFGSSCKPYHKCVTSKLLTQGFNLPSWLCNQYKKINMPELLRLLLNYGVLDGATSLVMEYFDAVLGKGKEYFGLKSSLHFESPAVWMPYRSIDKLLAALNKTNDPTLITLNNKLLEKIDIYFERLESITNDKLYYVNRMDV